MEMDIRLWHRNGCREKKMIFLHNRRSLMVIIKSTEWHRCGANRKFIFALDILPLSQNLNILQWFTVMCVKMTMKYAYIHILRADRIKRKQEKQQNLSYTNTHTWDLLKTVTMAWNTDFHTEIDTNIENHFILIYAHTHAVHKHSNTQPKHTQSSSSLEQIYPLFRSPSTHFFSVLISLNGIILRVEVKRFYYIRIYIKCFSFKKKVLGIQVLDPWIIQIGFPSPWVGVFISALRFY